jgi:hypothetical protein
MEPMTKVEEVVADYIDVVQGGDFAKWDRHIAAGLSKHVPLDLALLTDMLVRPLAGLAKRVAAIEARRGDDLVLRDEVRAGLAAIREVKDAGVWRGGGHYKAGNFVSHQGSLWMAQCDSWNERPGDSGSWRLVAKAGKDAAR